MINLGSATLTIGNYRKEKIFGKFSVKGKYLRIALNCEPIFASIENKKMHFKYLTYVFKNLTLREELYGVS